MGLSQIYGPVPRLKIDALLISGIEVVRSIRWTVFEGAKEARQLAAAAVLAPTTAAAHSYSRRRAWMRLVPQDHLL